MSQNFRLSVYSNQFSGIIGQAYDPTTIATPFPESLHLASAIANHFLLTVGCTTVYSIALPRWRIYTLVDSHSRNLHGFPSGQGTAVVLTFQSETELLTYINNAYAGNYYNLSPITAVGLPTHNLFQGNVKHCDTNNEKCSANLMETPDHTRNSKCYHGFCNHHLIT